METEQKDKRVRIKETGEMGDLFELSKYFDFASVFVDGERQARYFKVEDIEILD